MKLTIRATAGHAVGSGLVEPIDVKLIREAKVR